MHAKKKDRNLKKACFKNITTSGFKKVRIKSEQ